MKYLPVEKTSAERVRRHLISTGEYDPSGRIIREGERILIPVRRPPEGWGPDSLVEREGGPARRTGPTWYGELLSDLPEGVRRALPRSFDVVGSLVIIRIPGGIEPYAHRIADAILAWNRSIRAVAQDRGVRGEERVRSLELLRGDSTETLTVEYGVRLAVDPGRVFFSPRLAYERHRIASLVREGERVLDMFAGCGAFSMHICRRVPSAEVYAVDMNPYAVAFLRRNAVLNRVDNLKVFEGRVEETLPGLPGFSRVIMNLPMDSLRYIPLASERLRGGWMHIYTLVGPEGVDAVVERVRGMLGRRGVETVRGRRVKGYAPGLDMFCLDVRVTPR